MHRETRRGEIWYVDWSPGRGSEQTGLRPAVIIQTDAANRNPRYPNTIVLTVSTKGQEVPFHVPVNPSAGNGLQEKSFVKCEQIMTISKERLIRRMGCLDEEQMETIAAAMRRVLSF
ncbi:MAG: type II toxin-antitoxin system PemK/MazF family toxin [Syntrophobacterales bacterium]|nr:MAG: type II toxin-antitoxin system PemK/MazF family toxin [Syntrophobacterales bacterium]